MDADWTRAAFVLIDTLMERLATEVICQNHHERAVCILRESRYLSGRIDVTRFNRRLRKLADWLRFIAHAGPDPGHGRGLCDR
jgi:hypothetical protein